TCTSGPIVRLSLPKERIFVASYEFAKELFDETRFVKAVTGPLAQVRELAGDGLFTALPEEHNWELAHRLLMPAFGPLPIKDVFPAIYQMLSIATLRDSNTHEYRDVGLSYKCCAMGTRFNSFYHEEQHDLVNGMVGILAECFTRSRRPPLPLALFWQQDRAFRDEIDKLVSVAEQLLTTRRKNPVPEKDLLNAMIDNKDPKTGEKLDDQTIIRNMITFLIAGHETTSGLLSFLFYELLANPEALAAAQEKVDAVIGTGIITVDHMGKLPCIEGYLRETLHLHPTAPAFSVRAKGDQVLAGRCKLQDGQVATVFLAGLHRDKAVYGADGDAFKPERIVGEKFSALLAPGSNGVRACIGRPFAWQEAILTVATLLQNFNFKKANPSYQLEIKTTLTIKPHDFYVKVRLRNESFLDHAGALATVPVSTSKDKASRALAATSLIDVLELCPSTPFSFGAFLASLPAMRVRQYSISSSPLANSTACSMTYSIIDAPPKSGRQGDNFHGVCSTYLERLSVGDTIQIGLRPSRAGFNLPADDTRPIIMSCAGTGLAPFHAFIQERAVKQEAGREIGPALLFYGLNSPDEDDMYREQFDEWEHRGVVSVRRAFTHAKDQSEGCIYVQDRIWHDRKQVVELFRCDAALYFCGAGIVGAVVDKVMIQIRMEQVKCSEEEAKEWVSEQKGQRFWADTFA
ncbi:hypothetical protein KAF25_000289, partial [Fusarium avenaceum]